MKKITDIKKNYFYYLLIIYLSVGIFASLNTGITHDEAHSNWIWELNRDKIFNIFLNKDLNISYLETYHGYYGAGFYFVSSILDNVFYKIGNFEEISSAGSILLVKHPTVFVFFVIASIYFRKIIFLSTQNKLFSNLSTFLFLTYPYIFGHSLFNIKDVPFMSIWLICSYYIIKIFYNLFFKSTLKYRNVFILSILTSYLISLRISGILIFIEYLIFLLVYLSISKKNLLHFIKYRAKEILIFVITFFIFIYLFYPSFWGNPYKFFDSIIFMSQHIQTVCTTTLGTCMKAQNLPSSYIFIWLFFKLPMLIILGFILFPFVEKKLFSEKRNILIIGSLILSVFSIIFLLIFLNVNLYDELRQILFIVPLFFIISLVIIYSYQKKLAILLTTIFIFFFLQQNFQIYPYNYLWLNNFNIFTNINKNFELDYWGVSTKNISNFLNKKDFDNKECIISNRNEGIKYFILDQQRCFKSFNVLHKKNKRPFLVALTERAINKGVPNNCTIIHQEKIRLNFSKEDLILAKLYRCI